MIDGGVSRERERERHGFNEFLRKNNEREREEKIEVNEASLSRGKQSKNVTKKSMEKMLFG